MPARHFLRCALKHYTTTMQGDNLLRWSTGRYFASGGKWFAVVNASRLVVISAEQPEQRRAFPNVDAIDEVQWQPPPK